MSKDGAALGLVMMAGGDASGSDPEVHANMQVSSPAWLVLVEVLEAFGGELVRWIQPAAVLRLGRLFFVLRFARGPVVAIVLPFAAQLEDTETSRTPCGCCCITGNLGFLLMFCGGSRGTAGGLGGVWVEDFELAQSCWVGAMFCFCMI
jgi:hypothetical protein